MTTVEPARVAFRRHLRAQALAATQALTIEKGWDRVRVGEVAAAVGVSRPTIYKEFGDKQGLGEALVLHEADRFLAGISQVLDRHVGDAAAAIGGAVSYTLEEAQASPLLRAVLTSPRAAAQEPATVAASTGVLPLLSTSASLLELASQRLVAWFGAHVPDVDAGEAADAVDALVRLTVSHLVLPTADPEQTGRRITEVAVRYLRL